MLDDDACARLESSQLVSDSLPFQCLVGLEQSAWTPVHHCHESDSCLVNAWPWLCNYPDRFRVTICCGLRQQDGDNFVPEAETETTSRLRHARSHHSRSSHPAIPPKQRGRSRGKVPRADVIFRNQQPETLRDGQLQSQERDE